MKKINLIGPFHYKTKRNYSKFMNKNKPHNMDIAKKFDKNFFDGDRKYGYGGYYYMKERWDKISKKFLNLYPKVKKKGFRLLDSGCGKGFFLNSLKSFLPDSDLYGFDISNYAIKNFPNNNYTLFQHDLRNKLQFKDDFFDFYTSFGVFHNLKIHEMSVPFAELNRVSKNQYIWVESYRNSKELYNLQCWAKTCESFFDPDEWMWIFKKFKYSGDYEFIYFK